MDELQKDLAGVETALADAELQYARLGAEIEALKAKRDALAKQIKPRGRLTERIAGMTKAQAIVEVLRSSTDPMTLGQIAEAVTQAGKKLNANGASVYIDGLLKEGRVVRVARGQYREA
jgi:capsule polysaccharide export protein KpsE/RkpR